MFEDMYGTVPDAPYPLCAFDFWYVDVNLMKKYSVPTPTPMRRRKEPHAGCHPINAPVGSWEILGIGQQWQAHIIHDCSTVVIPSNVWVEGTHSKVGTPQKGDEVHGAWFFYAPGSGIWLWTGKTKGFKNHDAGAKYMCGHAMHDAKDQDPKTAQCAAGKGFDTYTFQFSWKVEIVRANGVGGYACSGSQPNNIFKSGWAASSPCNCVESKGYSNCANGPPGTHPTAMLSNVVELHSMTPAFQV
jgi:hypothetical protein